jgi:hypothetical protein
MRAQSVHRTTARWGLTRTECHVGPTIHFERPRPGTPAPHLIGFPVWAPDLAAAIGEDFNTSGYPGVMKSWLGGLKEVSKRGYVSSYNIAQIYARLGDKNQALGSLETALEQRDSNLTYVKVESAFDDMRSDPRFQKVVQQLNMPQ